MAKFKPLQYAGCYSLDLYCDRQSGADDCGHSMFEDKSESFIGETFAEAAKEARAAGWTIHRATRTATCRHCNRLTAKARKIIGSAK